MLFLLILYCSIAFFCLCVCELVRFVLVWLLFDMATLPEMNETIMILHALIALSIVQYEIGFVSKYDIK